MHLRDAAKIQFAELVFKELKIFLAQGLHVGSRRLGAAHQIFQKFHHLFGVAGDIEDGQGDFVEALMVEQLAPVRAGRQLVGEMAEEIGKILVGLRPAVSGQRRAAVLGESRQPLGKMVAAPEVFEEIGVGGGGEKRLCFSALGVLAQAVQKFQNARLPAVLLFYSCHGRPQSLVKIFLQPALLKFLQQLFCGRRQNRGGNAAEQLAGRAGENGGDQSEGCRIHIFKKFSRQNRAASAILPKAVLKT